MNSAIQLMKAFGLHKPTIAERYGEIFNGEIFSGRSDWSTAALAIEYAEKDHERTTHRESLQDHMIRHATRMMGRRDSYEAVIVDELEKAIQIILQGDRVNVENIDWVDERLRRHINRRIQEGAFPESIMNRYRLSLHRSSGALSVSLALERRER